MSDRNDSGKTRQDLLDELAKLRSKLAEREGDEQPGTGEPSFSRPITLRKALTNWVAPVVLSIPLTTVVRSQAYAAPVPPTMMNPTMNPTRNDPTMNPTRYPTQQRPTKYPTQKPTYTPPTSAPRVPGLGLGAAAVLGAGLAAGAAKVAVDRAKSRAESSDSVDETTSDDDSKGNE